MGQLFAMLLVLEGAAYPDAPPVDQCLHYSYKASDLVREIEAVCELGGGTAAWNLRHARWEALSLRDMWQHWAGAARNTWWAAGDYGCISWSPSHWELRWQYAEDARRFRDNYLQGMGRPW